MNVPNASIAQMLKTLESGDPAAADKLLPLVYEELRALAAFLLAKEKPGMTLQATALVHDAYLRLVGAEKQGWESRRHFFNAAAMAMRRVLMDRGRRQSREKHGAGLDREQMDAVDLPVSREYSADQWEPLDAALRELQRHSERWAEIVQLRYFAGLSIEQAADVLNISPATVKSDWNFARAWLRHKVRPRTA